MDHEFIECTLDAEDQTVTFDPDMFLESAYDTKMGENEEIK